MFANPFVEFILANGFCSGCYREPTMNLHVYVHFPWCLQKCPYCDFVSYAVERENIDHEQYATIVIGELSIRAEQIREKTPIVLQSVFFGGGTPSLWSPRELGRVLNAIKNRWNHNAQTLEVTVECNPSSLDQEKAKALRDQGVNRLSVGVQSLDTERLKFLGRLHDSRGGLRALEDAVASGIERVSGDLIYGVHGQTADEARTEVATVAQTGVTHISAYNLTIEQGTRFGELARKGRLPMAEDSAMVESFFAVDETLGSFGMRHYEISNYAKPRDESRHNLGYWQGNQYVGLGCAAVGAFQREQAVVRYRNPTTPSKYLRQWSENAEIPADQDIEELDGETRLRERIMLGLRLESGFNIEQTANELGVTAWPEDREKAAQREINKGRLIRDSGIIRIPKEQWIWTDDIAANLF